MFNIIPEDLGPNFPSKLVIRAKLEPFQEKLLKTDPILQNWKLCTIPKKCKLVVIKAKQLQEGVLTILLPAGHCPFQVMKELERNLNDWMMATLFMNSFEGGKNANI